MKIESSTTALLLIAVLVVAILVLLKREQPPSARKRRPLRMPPRTNHFKDREELNEDLAEEIQRGGLFDDRFDPRSR